MFAFYYINISYIYIAQLTGAEIFPFRTGQAVRGALARVAGIEIYPMEMMEKESEELRPCRKCLIRDMKGQEAYFRSLREYIENLDMDIRVSDSLYEERLHVCKECGMLLEGMCRRCGCYVELRAAVLKNHCPGEKW